MMRTILFFLLWLFSAPVCAYPGWYSWASRSAGQLESMIVSDEEVICAIKEVPAHYTSPTLVQHVSTSNSGAGPNVPLISKGFPNPVGSNNCLICSVTCSTGVTINTPTDSAGNTWSLLTNITDSPNTTLGAIFGTFGAVAGTTTVTVTFSNYNSPSAGHSYASIKLSEFCYVATGSSAAVLDQQKSAAAAASTTPSTGSFTTTANGDLIYAAWFLDNGPAITNFAPGSTFSLLDADIVDSYTTSVSEYAVQTTAGAINPSFTLSSSTAGIIMAVALKADATKGTPAPSFSIIRELHFGIDSLAGSANLPFQAPCSGNLLIFQVSGVSASATAVTLGTPPVTDSKSNTWAVADQHTDPGSTVRAAICYAAAATSANNLTGTFKTNVAMEHSTLIFYDVAGAATSPLGNHTSNQGTQSSAGYLTTGTITPSQAHGLIFTTCSISFGTLYGIHGQYTLFDTTNAGIYQNATNGNGSTTGAPLDQDNGYAHEYNPDTTARTYTWSGTITGNDPTWTVYGAGGYGYVIAEFKASSPADPGYTYLYGGTTVVGLSGVDTWQPWKAPANSHGNTTMAVWGAGGAGSRKTSTTGAAGGGGGKGGDCSTALTPSITDYNCYTFYLGGGGVSAATPLSGNYSQAVDDALNYTTAASGKSAAANSATGATTSTGTSVAGPGGATHAGGNGATGTASGGGGGGGAGGPTGAGGAGSVTTGGTAGTGTPAAGSGGAGGASGGNHPGTIGNAPGGAGGGGFFSSSATVGGNGVPGQVIITVTIPATPPPVHMDYNVPFWNWYEF